VIDAIRLVGLNLGFAAVGLVVLFLCGFPFRSAWLPSVAGISLAVGLATCGLIATLGAMLGLDVSPITTAALAVIALSAWWRIARARPIGLGSLAPGPTRRVGVAFELMSLTLLTALSVSALGLAAATGLAEWDGWAMWAPKAHALYIDGDVWGPVFTDPAYVLQHQEYPILLPALEALAAGAIGRHDLSLVDVEATVVLVAFGWAAWGMLRLTVEPAIAAVTALALTGSAPLILNATSNYADAAVAAFTALGLLCLFTWLVHGSSPALVTAGLFLAAAGSTKVEGVAFAIAALVGAATTARAFGRRVKPLLMLTLGVAAVPIAWGVVDRINGPGARNLESAAFLDPDAVRDRADRIPMAATRLIHEAVADWRVALTAVALAVLSACLVGLWRYSVFVVLWCALSFAALVAFYYASTAPIDWHLAWSANRVVFSIVLSMATVAPMVASAAWAESRVNDRIAGRARVDAVSRGSTIAP
jgi:hypothetical protein